MKNIEEDGEVVQFETWQEKENGFLCERMN